MKSMLRCHPRYDLGNGRGWSRRIAVVGESGQSIQRYDLMCSAIHEDLDDDATSCALMLEYIHRVESGQENLIDADGNGWVAYITRDKVWFEGLYSQGEGGAVSLEQYKLAVETYLRFLADPEHKPIEVEFPDK